ncbi:unnamed protein product [Arabidopsis lyrata]|nr:uncharacterized protein LOC9330270 [Arabidopsis lyrata subsp. lyrata]CAH8255091.1 unnamed protein product [Arabidopsis lyrata]|eukprot:XP_002894209.2 uncharacterized protein LOC9330270 [Arabidopsis lyrata subsp. lyrata]
MSRNQNILITIDYVKEKIEWCIQKYMSLEQTMTYLYNHDKILHHITATIWEHLQRESPNFFDEYNKRCELARQIAKFNDLLAQQKYLIDLSTSAPVTKLQKLNDHHDDQDKVHDQWFVSDDFADIEDAFPSLIDPVAASVTKLQKPNDQDQICDQWINGTNDLASIGEIVSSLIDPSPLAETPQSDPPTTGLRYDIDSDDSIFEQWARDLEDTQQRMQKKIQRPPTRCVLSSAT